MLLLWKLPVGGMQLSLEKFYDKDIVDGCFDVSDLCGGQKKLLWNLSNLPERPDVKRG